MATVKTKSSSHKKIVILGGYGFVGSSVYKTLQHSKNTLIRASRRSGVNLLNSQNTNSFFRATKPDIVINCAAHKGSVHYISKFPADVMRDNLTIELNIYEAVRSYCPSCIVVNPISNCTYPGEAVLQKENEWLNGPVHASVLSYANTKRMWHVMAECYRNQYGIKTKNYIIPNAYGPGDYLDPMKTHALNGIVIRMIQAKRSRKKHFEIWGSGKPKREWIFVGDIGRIFSIVIEDPESRKQFINIAQNASYSILEIAEKIKKYVRYKGNIIPNFSFQDGAPVKQLDNTLFKKAFPKFTFTSLDEGIKTTVDYYLKALS